MKYLCVSSDGGSKTISVITKDVKEMVDNCDTLIFKFKNDKYYQYLGEDGWELID